MSQPSSGWSGLADVRLRDGLIGPSKSQDITGIAIGPRSRSSSSLSSEGGCLLDVKDADQGFAKFPPVSDQYPSFPAPFQSTRSIPASRNTLDSSTLATGSHGSWEYPVEAIFSYMRSIERSPSPASKKLGDTTYQYKSLRPDGTEIRLLRILPQKSLKIECKLSHVLLRELPDYVAISYTWGDL